MPLTPKGKKIMAAMKKEYGPKKAKSVFYAAENKGTNKGVHYARPSGKEAPEGRNWSFNNLQPVSIFLIKVFESIH